MTADRSRGKQLLIMPDALGDTIAGMRGAEVLRGTFGDEGLIVASKTPALLANLGFQVVTIPSAKPFADRWRRDSAVWDVGGYLLHYRPHTAESPVPHDQTIVHWLRYQAGERSVCLSSIEGTPPRLAVTDRDIVEAKRVVADLCSKSGKPLLLLSWGSTANRMLTWDVWDEIVDALAAEYVLALAPMQSTRYLPKVEKLPSDDLRTFLAVNTEAHGVISIDTFGLWAASAARESNLAEGRDGPRILGVFGSSNPQALARCDNHVVGKASCGGVPPTYCIRATSSPLPAGGTTSLSPHRLASPDGSSAVVPAGSNASPGCPALLRQ